MDTKKRILIVDDERINLDFFDVMLSKLGFEVHMAENGEEALARVRHLKPDLIILDNIMPKLTGWEVTRILKSSPEYAAYADIPIIMFSALDDVKDKVEGLELGAEDYITKPFNFAEVLARIRAVLRAHDLIGQIENREKRLEMGENAVRQMAEAASKAREALRRICVSCADPATVEAVAAEAVANLDELERRIASLNAEADGLRKEATDLAAIRRKVRPMAHEQSGNGRSRHDQR